MQNMAAHFETGLQFPDHLAVDTIRAALLEDLGLAGDITTNAIVSPASDVGSSSGPSRGRVHRRVAFG